MMWLRAAQPRRAEQERRRQQVEADVGECGVELGTRPVQRHEHERADQHHFEPDEEIEDVAGEKRTGHAHQDQLDERVVAECFASWVDPRKL